MSAQNCQSFLVFKPGIYQNIALYASPADRKSTRLGYLYFCLPSSFNLFFPNFSEHRNWNVTYTWIRLSLVLTISVGSHWYDRGWLGVNIRVSYLSGLITILTLCVAWRHRSLLQLQICCNFCRCKHGRQFWCGFVALNLSLRQQMCTLSSQTRTL